MYLDLNLPVVDEEQKAIEEEKQERLDDRDGSDPLAMLINTMAEEDDEKENPFCAKTHKKCGHTCQGVKNERKCLPCLKAECAEASGHFEGTNDDELCNICYTYELGGEPCS